MTISPTPGYYPEGPVRLVVPFPKGGSTAYTAEILAAQLQTELGQAVSADIVTGHFGINAMKELMGKTDGRTLMLGSINANSTVPVIQRKELPFDYEREIRPITRIAEFPSVMMTRRDVAASTLTDFLGDLKQTAGRLIYGTDYVGTYVDVDAILLGKAVDLPVACHLTNGAAAILADLIAGKSDLAMLNVATAIANIGGYKPLAVTSLCRLPAFPDVPTMAEAGYPHIGTSNWQGLFAPRATPEGFVRILHETTLRAMNSAAVKDAFAKVNATIATSNSPEIFAQEIAEEMKRWKEMIPAMMALPHA